MVVEGNGGDLMVVYLKCYDVLREGPKALATAY